MASLSGQKFGDIFLFGPKTKISKAWIAKYGLHLQHLQKINHSSGPSVLYGSFRQIALLGASENCQRPEAIFLL
jgi:hypothetical protein